MKKLMLMALAALGLQGASVHGAAYAATAAKIAPQALELFKAIATPMAIAGTGYYASNKIDSQVSSFGQKAENVAVAMNQKADSFSDKVGTSMDVFLALAKSPKVAKVLGLASKEEWSPTWYGKVWQGLCAVDGYTDFALGFGQKYLNMFQILQSVIKRSDREQAGQSVNLTPEQINAYNAYVAAKQQEQNAQVQASQPVYTPGRSGRSRARQYG
jgi:hypothetical protein